MTYDKSGLISEAGMDDMIKPTYMQMQYTKIVFLEKLK